MRTLTVASLALGLATLAAVPASARVVCTDNVCWHSRDTFDYPPSANAIIHDDAWPGGPRTHWHEHEGRGFWNGDSWQGF